MTYRDEILADNPLAFWEFNQTNKLASTVGGYSLTNTGVLTWTNSGPKNSGALQFDGSTQYVSSTTIPDFQDGTFTAEMWVKYGAQTMDYPTFMRRDGAGSAFLVRTRGPGAGVRVNEMESYTNGETCMTSPYTYADSTWHHVVFRSNAYVGTLYVDGNVRTTKSGAQSAGGTGVTPLYIGRGSGATEYFKGYIANVAIYPTDIGAARVVAHFNAADNRLPFTGWGIPLE